MRDALGFLSLLSSVHGTPPWWSDDPYRVMVEAVLVQNTAWENVLRTREGIGDRLSPQWVESLDDVQLEEAIRSCGFQKAKARTIRALTAWWRSFAFDRDAVMAIGAQDLTSQLHSIKGVGMETASVIALYAFHKPVMVVDAYTRRISPASATASMTMARYAASSVLRSASGNLEPSTGSSLRRARPGAAEGRCATTVRSVADA